MKKRLYQVCSAALLTVLVTNCAQDKLLDDVKPTSEKSKTTARGEDMSLATTTARLQSLSYLQYYGIPEPMIDVAAQRRVDTSKTSPRIISRYPFAIGASQLSGGGHRLYRFVSDISPPYSITKGAWPQINTPFDAGVFKIAVAREGTINYDYLGAICQNPTTGRHEIYRNTLSATGSIYGWSPTSYAASDLAFGYKASGQPQLYFLGDENVQGGHRIYRDDNGSATEIISGSAAVSLAVDGLGRLWVVNSFDQIFVNASPQTGGSFVPVPGAGKRIASDGPTIGLLGNTFLNHGYEIYQRDATSPILQNTWELQGGDATQIASNAIGDYFLVNDLGELFLATRQL